MRELLRELSDIYRKAMSGHSIPVKTSQDILERCRAALQSARSEAVEECARVCDKARMLICETEPGAVAKEAAADLAAQIRALAGQKAVEEDK